MDTPIVPSSPKKQNRTPNTECVICGKPLYRRPFELKKIRYSACLEHRDIAKKKAGITKAQEESLTLGREKGTNHLEGIPKSEESKHKRSKTMLRWHKNNPESSRMHGLRIRGENHYNWKGGVTSINQSIRRMTENRKWMDQVKDRDGKCMKCGSMENLESHHIKPLADLIEQLKIKSRQDALKYGKILWDLNNGITLCVKCHYDEHDRLYTEPREGKR